MGSFNAAYAGTPPWEIGRPQGEFVRLAKAGEIKGSVLDVGCGTGENALFLADLGHEVLGIDGAPLAIEKAEAKAEARGVEASFLVEDALDLRRLQRRFDTVIDCGLFHTLDDGERPVYSRSLASVLGPGGRYFMLCFNEKEPGREGPRRVTQTEIRASFRKGWRVEWIREAFFETSAGTPGARGWLSRIARE
ncbi:MAG: SAM-dependent methyltransferase [Euryarchaeota archaeon RBG_16_68_12]|nr:MAG: SAM-dependent methyltransferase [Euryarchaeota archaeon RBG_16_68_12]